MSRTKADGDHIVVLVADDSELKLFPSKDRLLDEDLVDQAGLKAASAYSAKLVFVIDKAASGASHCICRAKYYGITQLIGDSQRFVY